MNMEAKGKQMSNWRYSIRTKLLIGFGCVIVVVFLCTIYIYQRASNLATQLTYEKMHSLADYYTQRVNDELEYVRLQQIDMFNDRMLLALIGPNIDISDYERRERLLSVWDKVTIIEGISNLIQEGTIYLPRSGYRISSAGVRRIGTEDEARLKEYLQYVDGRIHFQEDQIFLIETGELGIRSEMMPKHVFVIKFSRDQIIEDLAKINTAEGSGAFWYQSDSGTMLEHSMGTYVGQEILDHLSKDENGDYLRTQRVTIEGETYLVFVGSQGLLGLFVEYCPEDAIMEPVIQFRNTVFGLFLFMILGTVFFAFYANWLVHRPINELMRAFQRIEEGNWTEHIVHNRKDEFSYLYDEFNEMEDHMTEMIEQVCVQTNLAQRAQMKQLQAQIAPHFLYNSFFSLSRKIKREEYEAAEALAKHLGTYFKYVTRNEADYVSLEQEVSHAKSYTDIQGIRFVNRIEILFEELPEPFKKITVPRLILQPLLENAFEHGLDNKEKDGKLLVHFWETKREYQIYIEDNGDVSDKKIQELREGLETQREGEVTSFYNIHRRLQYLYQGRAGLRVHKSRIQGLGVMVFIHKEAMHVPELVDC